MKIEVWRPVGLLFWFRDNQARTFCDCEKNELEGLKFVWKNSSSQKSSVRVSILDFVVQSVAVNSSFVFENKVSQESRNSQFNRHTKEVFSNFLLHVISFGHEIN